MVHNGRKPFHLCEQQAVVDWQISLRIRDLLIAIAVPPRLLQQNLDFVFYAIVNMDGNRSNYTNKLQKIIFLYFSNKLEALLFLMRIIPFKFKILVFI